MTVQSAAPPAELAALVGPDHVRAAAAADAVAGVVPAWVAEPGSGEEVAAALRWADGAGQRVAARGGGTKGEWGNPPAGLDGIVALRRLDAVLEHAWGDMTATVQAGCRVQTLQATLAAHGQRLALDPLWPERATVGGILATNDSGALRVRFGSLRDLIIGVTVALPNGTLARSGGKVVKNVAGYDLPKLLTGALGTLGVITEATFRLYPLPAAERSYTITASTVAALEALLLAIRDSPLVPTGLQVRLAQDAPPALDVRFEGVGAGLEAASSHLRRLAHAAGCGDSLAEADPAVWAAREALWTDAADALICKVGVVPTQIGGLGALAAQAVAPFGGAWAGVAQSVGICTVRLGGGDAAALPAALATLRETVTGPGGTVVVLHCPPALRGQVDVWGPAGDALPLMRRVKAEFDPHGILNPGRFVGGI
jgi:glycolate oxidase FAD binding subunit